MDDNGGRSRQQRLFEQKLDAFAVWLGLDDSLRDALGWVAPDFGWVAMTSGLADLPSALLFRDRVSEREWAWRWNARVTDGISIGVHLLCDGQAMAISAQFLADDSQIMEAVADLSCDLGAYMVHRPTAPAEFCTRSEACHHLADALRLAIEGSRVAVPDTIDFT